MPKPRRSSIIEAHDVFTKYHRHTSIDDDEDDDLLVTEPKVDSPPFPMFHRVEKTGVIYATTRAKSHGFSPETEEEWAKWVLHYSH